jgi:hypothetical protein
MKKLVAALAIAGAITILGAGAAHADDTTTTSTSDPSTATSEVAPSSTTSTTRVAPTTTTIGWFQCPGQDPPLAVHVGETCPPLPPRPTLPDYSTTTTPCPPGVPWNTPSGSPGWCGNLTTGTVPATIPSARASTEPSFPAGTAAADAAPAPAGAPKPGPRRSARHQVKATPAAAPEVVTLVEEPPYVDLSVQ